MMIVLPLKDLNKIKCGSTDNQANFLGSENSQPCNVMPDPVRLSEIPLQFQRRMLPNHQTSYWAFWE